MINTLKTLLLLLALAFIHPAHAVDAEKLVKIRLVPEHGRIAAGEEIWIGIEQSIKPEWHTYWKNPGDSGTAPRVKWSLPENFTISDIEWPVPHKLPIGPLTNYGYEDNVVLLQKLKVPATLPEGPFALSADIEVLVCREECIPEYGTYELILNGPESDTEDNSAFIKQALEKLPSAAPWTATYREESGFFVIELPANADTLTDVEFIPADWGLVANSAKPELQDRALIQARGDRPLATLGNISGLLKGTDNGAPRAFAFTAHKEGVIVSAAASSSAAPPMPKTALLKVLILALLGGLVLNLMPCVFPVLSIKALSLVKLSAKEKKHAQLHGLAYTAGIILSFLFIAALLIAFRAGGAQIGWGFQLQNPAVVTLLAYLLFLIGLNFSGVFEFSGALGNVGHKLTQGDKLKNSFFTGILATLVATPCTAPFMATAIGAALLQPPVISLIIFAALGLGLALPYLLLSFVPALQKILPKPGPWMETFRQFLAFPMFASAAWLIWVISQQAGSMGTLGALMGIVLIALGVWLLRYKRRIPALVTFAAALLLLPMGQMSAPEHMALKTGFGKSWSPAKLETALAGNDPVFVEMTAAWCITCKVNHAVALNIDSTKKVFADNGVQYLIGDWTLQDAAITEYLNSFGRNGVPIYVFYGRRSPETGQRPEPKVLPQILTPGIVSGAVTK